MSITLELLDYIKRIYREAFNEKIASAKLTIGLPVVEFYLEGNQYFIDMDNKVYIKDQNIAILHGVEIGYMKDGTIYLGS